jgi:DNA-binding transcriptional ArsR family regulator
MNDTPGLSAVAAAIGEPTRAAMLTALMAGRPLTASDLARVADVTRQTASAHLARLLDLRLVRIEAVGRHRYVQLADHEVAGVVERLMRLARRAGATRPTAVPIDHAIRRARICYDHLAGELGVRLYDRLMTVGHLHMQDRALLLTESGERFCARLGIDVPALRSGRRPICLACVDWSERRHHLAGALGAAILDRCLANDWARRHRGSRAVTLSSQGERVLLT